MDDDKRDEGLPEIAPPEPKPVKRRRSYDAALKREMVEATLNRGESVSEVARRYDVNTNQLFKWRRQYLDGQKPCSPALLPVEVVSAPCAGELEIVLAQGHRVSTRGPVDTATLCSALEVLR